MAMERLAKNKGLFIGLSCLSVGCLVSAFGYPLQRLEVYSQTEQGRFGYSYDRRFIITENDLNYPYGFNQQKAQKIAQTYESATAQKFFLLILSGLCASYALLLGSEVVTNAEIDFEVESIRTTGKKQLLLERVKHQLSLASRAQRISFMDEMKALMEEFGTPEQELIEADEINALYDEASETEEKEVTQSLDMDEVRRTFSESMDGSSWKAVSKAIAAGANREEILVEVLQADNEIGGKYLDFLKGKYL